MKRIKVIYIVGIGHSGSTLLDIILSQLPKVTSVGEIINLEHFVNANRLCTCGEKISNCKYWQKVLNTKKQNITSAKSFNQIHKIKNCSSFDYLSYMLTPVKNKLYSEEKVNYLALNNYYLFEAILKNSEGEIIVDSSKDWQRLLILKQSNLFDMKIIYLFRNGKANIESNKRKALDKNRPAWEYPGPFSQTMKFIKTTLLIRRILRLNFDKQQIFGISYEEFAANPENSINKIISFIGLSGTFNRIAINTKPNHNIGGNRMRFKPIKEIKLIEKWRKNLTSKEKAIFKILGGELINKSFKYHKYQNS